MTEEFYKIVIDSDHFDGSLTYGDLLIKGKSDKEIIISTYICHPSMANNECSGPSVATFLARWLKDRENFYSYRFIFAPETIGAICFISRNIEHIRKNVIAGINLTCVGDNNNFSLLTTRRANTRLDKIARKAITDYTSNYKEFDFKSRGSDERQYSHPNIDIPMISIMRSKYGTFSEYHTSKDNMNFVSPEGFEGSFNVNKNLIEIIENNKIYLTKFFGEPMMSKRKLVPDSWMTRRTKTEKDTSIINYKKIFDTIFECDGSSDLVDIANKFDFKFEEILDIITKLKEQGIIENDSDIDYSCKDWFKKT